MDTQGAGFAFDTTIMSLTDDFTMPQEQQPFLKPIEGDTSNSFFFGDEGIDTTGFNQLEALNPMLLSNPSGFDLSSSLIMDDTMTNASLWNSQIVPESQSFPMTPAQSFDTMYHPSSSALGKRPLQLDVQDFPQSKRHESMGDFTNTFTPISTGASHSNWTFDSQPTPPSSSAQVGLSDEAADVCTMWFNKYAVLPSDRHIDSLSQLTGESTDAIRHWFGGLMKQGMGSCQGDSAYKSQTGLNLQNDYFRNQLAADNFQSSQPSLEQQHYNETTVISDDTSGHENSMTAQPATSLRSGKMRCSPTDDLALLSRDSSKIYQCTRKCGKRYGRKCDWKRNEEEGYPCKSWVCSLCVSEGVENVKPCFRKYHFTQHFRNIHPGVDCDEYEEASIRSSETEFPRKCGFCRHTFDSRQERIDHIAEHFKQGKCMLEWNEEGEDSSQQSDDNDDDNDRPDGNDSDNSKPSSPSQRYPRGDSHFKSSGGSDSDGNGRGSNQSTQGGFFQFQLAQAAEDVITTDSSSDTSQTRSSQSSITDKYSPQSITGRQSSFRIRTPGTEHHNVECKLGGAEKNNQNALARDAVALNHEKTQSSIHSSNPISEVASDTIQETQKTVKRDQTGTSSTSIVTKLRKADNDKLTKPRTTSPTRLSGQGVIRDDVQLDAAFARGSSSLTTPSKLSSMHSGLHTGDSAQDLPRPGPSLEVAKINAIATISNETPYSFLSVKLLGAGGFSTVDEVVHRATNLRIGRKTLKNRNENAIEELKKEVNVLQKLRHPHVIRFLGAYAKGDKMSILVSPVAETTLALWLQKFSHEQPKNLVDIIVKMFGCLASCVRYLHEQRPVVKHMDIKPQNILIVEQGREFPHVVLTDFGVSSADELPGEEMKPWTRQYAAPEALDGYGRMQAADIWSLGCVYMEMASFPFSQTNADWNAFRNDFSGRKGKAYWQDVVGIQKRLTGFLASATTIIEQDVVRTLQSMLNPKPSARPDAASLTMVFAPAPCCVGWPNDNVIFPGPQEESTTAGNLSGDEEAECTATSCTHASGPIHHALGLSNAKDWLHQCTLTHEACCGANALATHSLPTRLIDICPDGEVQSFVRLVDGTSIVPSTDPRGYIALSHVWDQTQLTLETHSLEALQEGVLKETLPKAVNAAILVAQSLGHRYIYTDGLCVLQDSEADKRQECANMASVFRNAALTIVLDQLTDGLQESLPDGLQDGSTTQNVLHKTPAHTCASSALPNGIFATPGFGWDTRAWALQERLLSRRFLHLGDEQMYWECNTLKASETFPQGLPPLIWEKVHTRSNAGDNKDGHEHLRGATGHVKDGHTRLGGVIANATQDGNATPCQREDARGKHERAMHRQLTVSATSSQTTNHHRRVPLATTLRPTIVQARTTSRRCDSCDTASAGNHRKGNFTRHMRGNQVCVQDLGHHRHEHDPLVPETKEKEHQSRSATGEHGIDVGERTATQACEDVEIVTDTGAHADRACE